MKDTDLVYFEPSSIIFPKAAKVFETEKQKLQSLFPFADIQQVGSTAVPGAVGKFDVDIQIRVASEDTTQTIETMRTLRYLPKHQNIWTADFAIFIDYSDFIDFIITTKDSPFDDFYRVRDYLMNNPLFLERYNQFKLNYQGKPYAVYRNAKQFFLGGNGKVKFLNY